MQSENRNTQAARAADNNAAQSGFTVLEAIVSIAIFAAALLPIMEFQSQSARAVDALERVEGRIVKELYALASLEPVMRDFANERAAPPGYRVAAERELARRIVRGAAGVPGRFELRLVELTLTPTEARQDGVEYEPQPGAIFNVYTVYARPIFPSSDT